MKRLIVIVIFLSSVVISAKQPIDGIVWIVGENSILKSEIEEQRQIAQYNGTKFDTGNANCIIAEQIAICIRLCSIVYMQMRDKYLRVSICR